MKGLIIFISLICLFLTSGCDDDSSPTGPSGGGNEDYSEISSGTDSIGFSPQYSGLVCK